MPDTNAGMPIELHELLRVEPESITAENRQDMDQVWRVVSTPYPQPESLACAVAMLANVLGSIQALRRFWYSSSDENDRIGNTGLLWVTQEDLERIAIQVLGFATPDQSAETTALTMRIACEDAVSSGLLESQHFDIWHPGMRSGAGMIKRYRATPYGVARARQDHSRSYGFHSESPPRSQPSSPRAEEPCHTGCSESEVVKTPTAAGVRDSSDRSGAFIPTAQANASVGDIIVNNMIQIDSGEVAEKVLNELSRREAAGSTPDNATGAADTSSDAGASHPQPGKGMPIAEVIRLAEEHVKAHDGAFPGRNKLAKFIKCPASSVSKAIKQSTYLKARLAEHERAKNSGREVQIKGSMDEFSAGADPEPAEPDDRESSLASLIAEQEADQRRDEHQRTAARRQYKAD